MSFTYSQPPGRTRQQRGRKPRQQQRWDSEEQVTDTTGASIQPSGYLHPSSHHSVHPRRSPLSSHEHASQHESPNQQRSLQ